MKTKTLEDILFQVYELGVQQTDCDLTKKANTIMLMLTNKRVIAEDYAKKMVIEELMRFSPAYIEGMITHKGEDFSYAYIDARTIDKRIEELKQD